MMDRTANMPIKDSSQSSVPASEAFVDSYAELVQWMRSRIFSEKNVDDLLEISRFYGMMQWSNFSGTYEDPEIEEFVARKVLENRNFHATNAMSKNGETVLIASELYDSGGHSRVVLNWLKAFEEEKSHRLVVTRFVSKGFENWLRERKYPYHLCKTVGINLISEIVQNCEDARRIVLHIHPDDIIGATAAKFLANAGKQVIYYNHADHVFSYGISFADIVGEVSKYGIALNKRIKRGKKSCFLGIPIQPSEIANKSVDNASSGCTVISGGTAYKYAPSDVDFADFIDQLLSARPDTTILLVGPTGLEPWWKQQLRGWGGNVKFLGQLPHGEYLRAMACADVYVDSFPVTGGTAFPEALLNGKRVAGLAIGMQGYSPVDELRARTVVDLVSRVEDLLDASATSMAEMEAVRSKAVEAHSLDAFRIRAQLAYEGKCTNYFWEVRQAPDTHWLEMRWREQRILEGYVELDRVSAPLLFVLKFLLKASGLFPFSRSKYLIYSFRRVVVRVLPSAVVGRLLSLREMVRVKNGR